MNKNYKYALYRALEFTSVCSITILLLRGCMWLMNLPDPIYNSIGIFFCLMIVFFYAIYLINFTSRIHNYIDNIF